MIPVGVACSCLVVSYLCVYATGKGRYTELSVVYDYMMLEFFKQWSWSDDGH